ncbi:MAG: hypothetical protein KGJ77_11210, partial [Acidobacteriota bacterium]|nr:hypothetical protein [Acidobacteriota bacterium]
MQPDAIAVSAGGDLYITDSTNSVVRKIDSAGSQILIAGDGITGFAGDGEAATDATLSDPVGVAVDASGDVFIADAGNNRVRVVAGSTGTIFGHAVTAGDIYTVAGTGIAGDSGDAGPATEAQLNSPQELAVDSSGDLFIADGGNARIRVVAAGTGTVFGQSVTADDIYTVAGTSTAGYGGDGGVATAAELANPTGLAFDTAGDLFIADFGNNRVRAVAAVDGTLFGQSVTADDIYTVAGTGTAGYSGDNGPATEAELRGPRAVAVDLGGNLLVSDETNSRVRGVAATDGTLFGQSVTADDIYTVAGNGFYGYGGDGSPADSAYINGPHGLAFDTCGNLFIADFGNNRVRAVAAADGALFGQSVTADDIYTVAGNGSSTGSAGDGGPPTDAQLSSPQNTALDASGDLFIADAGNNRVRVVAGSTGTLFGQSVTAGQIYTVAGTGSYGYSGDGGPATDAQLGGPHGVVVDSQGNLFIADTGNNVLRMVAASDGTAFGQSVTAGDVYTVAGNGTQGYSGDGGLATDATLGYPNQLAVDASGDVFMAVYGDAVIRVVAATNGTIFGQSV